MTEASVQSSRRDTVMAWAPWLPQNWSQARLRWLARVFAGGTPSKDQPEYWADGTIPWLNSGSVNDWTITQPSTYITEGALRASSARWIPPGSVVIALAGQGRTKGMAARLEINSTCNQSMAAIVPGTELDYRFLQFWLTSNYQSIRNLSGGDNRDGLNLQHVGDIECPLPPLDEQRRIADFLDTETTRLDALIQVKRQLVEITQERFRSLASAKLFGVKGSVATLDSGVPTIGPVPADWRVVRNKDIFREVAELSTTGAEELLSVSHLTGVTPRSEKTVTMFLAESLEGYKRVQRGDLVVNTMWAWMGALGVSNHEGIVSPAYGVYRSYSPSVHPPYFDLVYRSPEYVCEMTRHSKGVWTSRLRLYPEAFLALRIPLPPLPFQVQAAELCHAERERSEHLVKSVEASIDALNERRQVLITAAVTGELDVVTAQGTSR